MTFMPLYSRNSPRTAATSGVSRRAREASGPSATITAGPSLSISSSRYGLHAASTGRASPEANGKRRRRVRKLRLLALLSLVGLLGFASFAYGFVVDFMDFRFWPVFNVADSCISVGSVLLLISLNWTRAEKP